MEVFSVVEMCMAQLTELISLQTSDHFLTRPRNVNQHSRGPSNLNVGLHFGYVNQDLPSHESLMKIEAVAQSIVTTKGLGEDDLNKRKEILEQLEKYLHNHVLHGIILNFYGSSVNGFGLKTSDLDIAMSLPPSCLPTTSQMDACDNVRPRTDSIAEAERQLVKNMVGTIKRSKMYHSGIFAYSVPILSRLPLIKLFHVGRRFGALNLGADISIDTGVARRNTFLLQSYNKVDERVKPLVLMMKELAKCLWLDSSTRNGLSSYAWTILVIHYLQRSEPPVLPCLQEIGWREDDGDANGWLRWKSDNCDGIGKLWVRLIEHVLDILISSTQVICIHHLRPVSALSMEWQSPNSNDYVFHIQDPFELQRNLGQYLNKLTKHYLIRALHWHRCQTQTLAMGSDENVGQHLFDVEDEVMRLHPGYLKIMKSLVTDPNRTKDKSKRKRKVNQATGSGAVSIDESLSKGKK